MQENGVGLMWYIDSKGILKNVFYFHKSTDALQTMHPQSKRIFKLFFDFYTGGLFIYLVCGQDFETFISLDAVSS